MVFRLRTVLALGGFAALAWPASAAEVTLAPSRDNTIYEEYTTNSNGAGYLFAGRAGGGGIRRALLRFDVAGAIPQGAQIDEVRLVLTVSRAASAELQPAALHRALVDWGEAGSNAGERAGIGTQAQPGDATWLARFYPSDLWPTPGGEFDGAASVSDLLGGEGSHTLESTPVAVADVQSWLDDPTANFGWVLRGDESGPATAKRIDSRESAAATRPALTVVYSPAAEPVPMPAAALVLLGVSLLALVVQRAR
jgi:hypothetical protein